MPLELILPQNSHFSTMTPSLPNACPRCLLRLRNVRAPNLYSPRHPHPASPPCPLCFNILHDKTFDSIVSTLPSHLSRLSHDFRFKINATFPISASLIRHRIARVHNPPSVQSEPVSLREAFKWALCPRITDTFRLRYTPDAPLFLDIFFEHPSSDSDILALHPARSPPRKKQRTYHHNQAANHGIASAGAIARTLASMSDDAFRKALGPAYFPPPMVKDPVTVSISLSVENVLVAGSYNKFSRIVSQTPWFVDAPVNVGKNEHQEEDEFGRKKRTAVSVEDVVVAGMKDVLKPEKVTFTAGGREDVDVRMLGGGRPFVVEVVNANVVPSLITDEMVGRMVGVSERVGGGIEVRGLRIVEKEYFGQMRMFEAEKRKCYRCVVWVSREVELEHLEKVLQIEGGVMLKQKTPLRVLHRRTQAVRERRVFEMKVVRVVSSRFFVLDVVAAAGTYIKEFVHGDNGRTVPNVAMMLECEADIVQLDVMDIHAKSGGRGGDEKT